MPTLRAMGSDTNVATRPVTLAAVSITAAMATSPKAYVNTYMAMLWMVIWAMKRMISANRPMIAGRLVIQYLIISNRLTFSPASRRSSRCPRSGA